MKEFSVLIFLLKQFWGIVKRRKAWLRVNRIDYHLGRYSERTYRLGNLMINGAVVIFYDFWIFLLLLILGPIYFF